MRHRHAFVPAEWGPMESRLVLSAGGLTAATAAVIAPTPTPTPIQRLNLQGTVKGIERPSPLASAIPGDLLLEGKGTVSPLGHVRLVGTFSIRSGEPTFYDGRVSLITPKGGVSVHIFGIQGGPSGPPAHLHYQITGGWGIYHGATGKGDVVYTQALSGTATGGTAFSLTFGSPSPVATA